MATRECNLLVVGGGPAGLSAAINGASELDGVTLLDSGYKEAPGHHTRQLGGQAIGSTSIENYAGFPEGITGCELMARFERQAEKLGADIMCPEHAASLELVENDFKRIVTRQGTEIIAKTVILANGLSYRKLPATGVNELLGRGVLYGAPTSNPDLLGECTICVVGGANSAGQAVMHLSKNSRARIKMVVRGDGIESQMSKYLVDRIHACHNVEVLAHTNVQAAHGVEKLERLHLVNSDGSDDGVEVEANHLFIFIGAIPKTQWLNGVLDMDPRHFIVTGSNLGAYRGSRLHQETSMPGVFAAGDIRWGSVKRVAAAVGEGSGAVAEMHRYLAATNQGD